MDLQVEFLNYSAIQKFSLDKFFREYSGERNSDKRKKLLENFAAITTKPYIVPSTYQDANRHLVPQIISRWDWERINLLIQKGEEELTSEEQTDGATYLATCGDNNILARILNNDLFANLAVKGKPTLFDADNNRLFITVTTLPEGADGALVPKPDFIRFVRQRDDEEWEIVAMGKWDDVINLVGHLFQDTDIYPPRYCMVNFPNDAELKAIGVNELNDIASSSMAFREIGL